MSVKKLEPWPTHSKLYASRAGRKKTFDEPAMRVRIPVRLKTKFDQWLKKELGDGMQGMRGKARGSKKVARKAISETPVTAAGAGSPRTRGAK